MSATHTHRSAMPWMFGIAFLLTLLSPVVFLGVLVTGDGDLLVALAAALADLAVAAIAAHRCCAKLKVAVIQAAKITSKPINSFVPQRPSRALR